MNVLPDENVPALLDCPAYQETSDQEFFGHFERFPSTSNISSNHQWHENALPCEEIIKAAVAQYIHACGDEGPAFSACAVPAEDQDGVELVHLLLTSAEMINSQRYEEASSLLNNCNNISSHLGKPIERLCYHFSQALQERIQRQTCGEPNKEEIMSTDYTYGFNSDYARGKFCSFVPVSTTALPFTKLLQLTSVQAILDGARHNRRIHVIDLGIRTGCQWAALIESLSLRFPLSSVKITAVGVNSDDLEDCGRRLTEFAKSLSIPFSYCSIKISTLEEISEVSFNVKEGEFVAVYAPTVFRTLLHDPVLLENTVHVIRKLNPSILVISEVEGNHNSPYFNDRFIETLLYYCAYFDYLEAMLPDRNDFIRVKFEELSCGKNLRNMIACEGEERRIRHVDMDMWRSFLRIAGFREKQFSPKAWYQVRLLIKEYDNAGRITVEKNGFAMSVGWCGMPLHTLSSWGCMRGL